MSYYKYWFDPSAYNYTPTQYSIGTWPTGNCGYVYNSVSVCDSGSEVGHGIYIRSDSTKHSICVLYNQEGCLDYHKISSSQLITFFTSIGVSSSSIRYGNCMYGRTSACASVPLPFYAAGGNASGTVLECGIQNNDLFCAVYVSTWTSGRAVELCSITGSSRSAYCSYRQT